MVAWAAGIPNTPPRKYPKITMNPKLKGLISCSVLSPIAESALDKPAKPPTPPEVSSNGISCFITYQKARGIPLPMVIINATLV